MQPTTLEQPRDICTRFDTAASREWLVTNGIGGYASGTIAGSLSRRYHALLCAAKAPPLGRRVLLAHTRECATCDGAQVGLDTNEWADGSISPRGCERLRSFHLDGSIPVWRYEFSGRLLEKRIWMARERNATIIRYTLLDGPAIGLTVDALATDRDHHALCREWDQPDLYSTPVTRGVVLSDGRAPLLHLFSPDGDPEAHRTWHSGFRLRAEADRGMDCLQDLLHIARFTSSLAAGQSLAVVASDVAIPGFDVDASIAEIRAHERGLLEAASPLVDAAPAEDRPTAARLSLAADQFVVRRGAGHTILAGYPWFQDWGRDAMIALPGLLLATGRAPIAESVLRTFAVHAAPEDGLIPNRFPDDSHEPAYNAVDATLWFVEALRSAVAGATDNSLLQELFPVVRKIIQSFVQGARFGIGMDPNDALLFAGEPGIQLTWMDAKIGDRVITRRAGKTIEVNALWVNALLAGASMAEMVGEPCHEWRRLADRARDSFNRFWNESQGCCFDVIDGPDGPDASVRPNQCIALSLPDCPLLTEDHASRAIALCDELLRTPVGIRTLSPHDPRYRAHYEGDMVSRDESYHQGTAWGWLLGPHIRALLRAGLSENGANAMLRGAAANLAQHGVGSLSEISDADPPHTPRGCFAQAWSVGQLLETYNAVNKRAQSRGLSSSV